MFELVLKANEWKIHVNIGERTMHIVYANIYLIIILHS